jgi:hypothetical protein
MAAITIGMEWILVGHDTMTGAASRSNCRSECNFVSGPGQEIENGAGEGSGRFLRQIVTRAG